MSANKLRKLYTRKNCVHMCYKGKVFAKHDVLPGGELVLSETIFTADEKVYAEPNDDTTIIVTKADNSISEIWGIIDLNNLPRKNAAINSSSASSNTDSEVLTLEQLIAISEKKKQRAQELDKKRRGIPWYTINVTQGKKSTIKFHPTYGLKTLTQVNELLEQHKVNNIEDLSSSEYNSLCEKARHDYEEQYGSYREAVSD